MLSDVVIEPNSNNLARLRKGEGPMRPLRHSCPTPAKGILGIHRIEAIRRMKDENNKKRGNAIKGNNGRDQVLPERNAHTCCFTRQNGLQLRHRIERSPGGSRERSRAVEIRNGKKLGQRCGQGNVHVLAAANVRNTHNIPAALLSFLTG